MEYLLQGGGFLRTYNDRLRHVELAEDMSKTKEIISALKFGQRIAIFIGPEGGFEEAEVEFAKENGVIPVSLGKRILRTETAGFTTLSILMYEIECAFGRH